EEGMREAERLVEGVWEMLSEERHVDTKTKREHGDPKMRVEIVGVVLWTRAIRRTLFSEMRDEDRKVKRGAEMLLAVWQKPEVETEEMKNEWWRQNGNLMTWTPVWHGMKMARKILGENTPLGRDLGNIITREVDPLLENARKVVSETGKNNQELMVSTTTLLSASSNTTGEVHSRAFASGSPKGTPGAPTLNEVQFFYQIPGHHAPPLVLTSALVYAISVLSTFKSGPQAEEVAPTSNAGHSPNGRLRKERDESAEGAAEHPSQQGSIKKAVQRWPGWTILSGLPDPKSLWWTVATVGVNVVLCLFVVDLVYRAPLMYQSNDLSFARVGYVSDTTASLLIREPTTKKLPVFVSYRSASDASNGVSDDAWKAAGKVYWLSNDTDYTFTVSIKDLKPARRYQYAVSNNHTGYFTTAPNEGHVAPGTDKLTFLTSSCIKPRFPYNPLSHPLSMPGFKHLAQWIPTLKASFMLFLGDFIYIDVPRRFGSEPETYRREYRQVYNSPDWPSVSQDLPWIHVMDDHEIANDWDRNTTAPYPAAADPWNIYHTSINPPPITPDASYFQFTH
ncbi:MAG: hypothetical protein Q9218_008177, partial [Villophora microphyllina]